MPQDQHLNEIRFDFLDFLLFLLKKKWLIISITSVFVFSGIAFSLLTPKIYTASATLMPPEKSNSSFLGMMKDINLNNFLGGNLLNNDNKENIYIAILNSRSLRKSVIDSFNLIDVYEFSKKSKFFIEDVYKALAENTAVYITEEATLQVDIEDESPSRAAQMANFMVYKLDAIYKRLSRDKSRHQRIFLENRLKVIKTDLAKVEEKYVSLQKSNMTVDVDEQTKATIQAGASAEAQYQAAKLQLELAKSIYSSNSPEIQELQIIAKELLEQKNRLYRTKISDLMLPLTMAPELGLEFLRLQREVKIQNFLYQLVLEQYEKAKLEESRTVPEIQVLDIAVPPQKRTRPKRTILVIFFFIAGLCISIILAGLFEHYKAIKRTNSDRYKKLLDIKANLFKR